MSETIGYCSYCKDKVYDNEEYQTIGKKIYHQFCYEIVFENLDDDTDYQNDEEYFGEEM